MGVMTDSMKRLRSEADALRRARGNLMRDLAIGTEQRRDAVARMQAGFRGTHGEMARIAKKARVAFAMDLAAGAMKMIGGFHNSRTAMAARDRAERTAFVLGQKQAVAGLRQAVAADLAGAHRFWFGSFAAEKPMRGPSMEKEDPMKSQSGHLKTKGSAAKGVKKY